MRFLLGAVLLAAIAMGLAWAWYRFVWAQHPSRRLRRASAPHDMIDVPLAPDDQDEIQRPAGARSDRSTRLV